MVVTNRRLLQDDLALTTYVFEVGSNQTLYKIHIDVCSNAKITSAELGKKPLIQRHIIKNSEATYGSMAVLPVHVFMSPAISSPSSGTQMTSRHGNQDGSNTLSRAL
jgi:hypothetical protein